MNKTAKLAFVGILLMVSGCSKQSQVQPAATSREPSVVQAAAPAVPTAPVMPPQPAVNAASQSGLLTPHPSAGQRVDEGYLLSSDQNFAVGVQLVTETSEMLFVKLAIANRKSAPVIFDVKEVTMNALGRNVTVVPRTVLATMYSTDAGTSQVIKLLRSNYWDDSTVLAPSSQEEHFLLAVCGKGCPMPVTAHIALEGQTYDFGFGDASNAPVSSADPPAATSQIQRLASATSKLTATVNAALIERFPRLFEDGSLVSQQFSLVDGVIKHSILRTIDGNPSEVAYVQSVRVNQLDASTVNPLGGMNVQVHCRNDEPCVNVTMNGIPFQTTHELVLMIPEGEAKQRVADALRALILAHTHLPNTSSPE